MVARGGDPLACSWQAPAGPRGVEYWQANMGTMGGSEKSPACLPLDFMILAIWGASVGFTVCLAAAPGHEVFRFFIVLRPAACIAGW